jgi:hypothetical protein
MNRITDFFLRARSWEIFLLLFGLMSVSPILIFSSTIGETGKVSPLFFGLMVLFAICLNAWFWAVGSFLNTIVRPTLRPGVRLFRFAVIYPIVYIAVFSFFFPPQPAVFAVIFPLHLLAMFCMFYLLNFVSKNLALAETGRDVTFYDYAGPFFLLWFFPIGVWTVQPRINRLYAEGKSGGEIDAGAAR